MQPGMPYKTVIPLSGYPFRIKAGQTLQPCLQSNRYAGKKRKATTNPQVPLSSRQVQTRPAKDGNLPPFAQPASSRRLARMFVFQGKEEGGLPKPLNERLGSTWRVFPPTSLRPHAVPEAPPSFPRRESSPLLAPPTFLIESV